MASAPQMRPEPQGSIQDSPSPETNPSSVGTTQSTNPLTSSRTTFIPVKKPRVDGSLNIDTIRDSGSGERPGIISRGNDPAHDSSAASSENAGLSAPFEPNKRDEQDRPSQSEPSPNPSDDNSGNKKPENGELKSEKAPGNEPDKKPDNEPDKKPDNIPNSKPDDKTDDDPKNKPDKKPDNNTNDQAPGTKPSDNSPKKPENDDLNINTGTSPAVLTPPQSEAQPSRQQPGSLSESKNVVVPFTATENTPSATFPTNNQPQKATTRLATTSTSTEVSTSTKVSISTTISKPSTASNPATDFNPLKDVTNKNPPVAQNPSIAPPTPITTSAPTTASALITTSTPVVVSTSNPVSAPDPISSSNPISTLNPVLNPFIVSSPNLLSNSDPASNLEASTTSTTDVTLKEISNSTTGSSSSTAISSDANAATNTYTTSSTDATPEPILDSTTVSGSSTATDPTAILTPPETTSPTATQSTTNTVGRLGDERLEPAAPSSGPHPGVIVGAVVGAAVGLGIMALLLFLWRKKRQSKRQSRQPPSPLFSGGPDNPSAYKMFTAEVAPSTRDGFVTGRQIAADRLKHPFQGVWGARTSKPTHIAFEYGEDGEKQQMAATEPVRRPIPVREKWKSLHNPFSDANGIAEADQLNPQQRQHLYQQHQRAGSVPEQPAPILQSRGWSDDSGINPVSKATHSRAYSTNSQRVSQMVTGVRPATSRRTSSSLMMMEDPFEKQRDKFRSDPFDLEFDLGVDRHNMLLSSSSKKKKKKKPEEALMQRRAPSNSSISSSRYTSSISSSSARASEVVQGSGKMMQGASRKANVAESRMHGRDWVGQAL